MRTHQCKHLKGALVDFASTIRNDADDDLLPAFLAPHFGAVSATEVGNVLDDAYQKYMSTRGEGKGSELRTRSWF